MKRLIFILLIFFCRLSAYDHYLTVCAIFRDDAPYLKEWIDFHLKQGVEHFYLYNNLSRDNYAEVLAPFIKDKLVTLTEWPHEHSNEIEWVNIQCNSYMDCIKKIKDKVKWCAFIDTDEFLFSPQGKLPKVLQDYEKYSGVVVNWVLYGTSNIEKIPANKKMLDCLIMRAEYHHLENRWVKTIAQPKFVRNKRDVHTFNYFKGYAVTENKKQINNSMSKKNSVKKLRINHYRTRDENFLLNGKKNRSKNWSNENRLNKNDLLNQVYDPILSSTC